MEGFHSACKNRCSINFDCYLWTQLVVESLWRSRSVKTESRTGVGGGIGVVVIVVMLVIM